MCWALKSTELCYSFFLIACILLVQCDLSVYLDLSSHSLILNHIRIGMKRLINLYDLYYELINKIDMHYPYLLLFSLLGSCLFLGGYNTKEKTFYLSFKK